MRTWRVALSMAALMGFIDFALSIGTAGRTGSDDRAMNVAAEMRPGEKRGHVGMGLTPNERQKRVLFALQAASGAGILCYAYLEIRKRRSAA